MQHKVADFQAFFSKKPKGYNISPVQQLKPFIEEYPDQELATNLFRLQTQFPYYRAIHGDGNCFYRAIMFLYLREAELGHYERLFPHANILACKKLPFENPQKFTSDSLLEYAWQRYLLPLAILRPLEREKELEKLINSSANLDAILVAYLRKLNYDYILQHRSEYQTFSYGGFEQDLERIITFGQESEGFQLLTLAMILQAQITVLMVHRDIYQKVLYNENPRKNYIISYRPGHYDIPSDTEQYTKSKTAEHNSFNDRFLQITDSYLHYSQTTPGNPRNPENTGSNYQRSMNESSFLRKKSNSYQPEVIIIKKPSELMRISGPSRMQAESKKPPLNLKQFRKSVQQKTPDKASTQPSEKISRLERSKEESPKVQSRSVTKIRSSFAQNQAKQKRQRIVFESSICIGVIALLILGLTVI